MKKNKFKLGIILSSDPNFLGGLAIYQKNLIPYLSKNAEISLIYKGSKDEKDKDKNINLFQIKSPEFPFIGNLLFELKIRSFLKRNKFNIINSHGFTGLWMDSLKSRRNCKIIHTYHGSTYHFYKNHLKKFGKLKKILFSPILIIPYFIEKFPMKKADKIICVSEHVKKDLVKLHGKRENMKTIRTGVDLKIFKKRNQKKMKKILNLDQNKTYGLYIGRGGFWTKGLDKIINLSREIYLLDKNFRLIVIGAEKEKIKHLLDNKFVILFPPQSREILPFYYNVADLFFSMSRCEGGAPTMVTSEAMASECLIISDQEANQEIIKDGVNGLIVDKDYKKEAEKILKIIRNKKRLKEILKNSLKDIKNLSLDKWGARYLKYLLN